MHLMALRGRTALITGSVFLATTVGGTAWGQFEELYTFTSGNPPIGDGNVYPRSLNPARNASGGVGISGGTFPSNGGVDFSNLNGNPAFFDANNLLTRPASLIQNEAFWTDPKNFNFVNSGGQVFPFAQMGFFVYGAEGRSEFGFDVAIASASGNVPTSLAFSIQGDDDWFGSGQLLLTPDGGSPENGIFGPSDVGTFASLGGRQGREARFRFDMSELLGLLEFEGEDPGFDGNDDPIDIERNIDVLAMDFRLVPLVTPGGTTQIAFDNVVLDGAEPFFEPEPVILPPLPPAGPNRPQYTFYAEVENPPTDGDVNDLNADLDAAFGDEDFAQIQVNQLTQGLGAAPATSSLNVIFTTSSTENGLVGHEAAHAVQTPSTFVPPDAESNVELAGETAFLGNALQDVVDGLTNGRSPDPQIVEILSEIQTNFGDAAEILEGLLDETDITPLDDPNDTQFQIDVQPTNSPEGGGNGGGAGLLLASLQIVQSSTLDAGAMYYQGYSPREYQRLVEGSGGPRLGDMGSYLTPTFGDDGQQVGWRVASWVVSDQSGFYTPIVTNIPEPVTGLAGGALAGLVLRRRYAR